MIEWSLVACLCALGDAEGFPSGKSAPTCLFRPPSTPQDFVACKDRFSTFLFSPFFRHMSFFSSRLESRTRSYPLHHRAEMQAPTSDPASNPTGTGSAKPRRRGSSSGQTAKKRELDRIAQKKSRERARNRVAELEEKIRRLQSDDKQKQISELMRVIEDLRSENEKLRSMTEKIRSLTETVGPALKGIALR